MHLDLQVQIPVLTRLTRGDQSHQRVIVAEVDHVQALIAQRCVGALADAAVAAVPPGARPQSALGRPVQVLHQGATVGDLQAQIRTARVLLDGIGVRGGVDLAAVLGVARAQHVALDLRRVGRVDPGSIDGLMVVHVQGREDLPSMGVAVPLDPGFAIRTGQGGQPLVDLHGLRHRGSQGRTGGRTRFASRQKGLVLWQRRRFRRRCRVQGLTDLGTGDTGARRHRTAEGRDVHVGRFLFRPRRGCGPCAGLDR